MSIVDNLLNRFGFFSQQQLDRQISEAVKKELDKVPRWLGETADAQRWTMPAPPIFANQADLYRLSPILGTAIDILAGDIGTSKFNVKRMRGEDELDIPNHEFELLLRNPNPADSGIELIQYTTSNYKLNGNSVWWLNKADKFAKPDEIWSIPFSMITPIPDERLYIDHYDYFPGNGKQPLRFEVWEIVHFKTYNPHNRFVGLSPLESLITTITGDLSMRATNSTNYTEYGGAPPSILAFKDFVPKEEWEDIKKEKTQAAKRNQMMMLRGVGDGVTWLQRALSNKDMEFVTGLKQNMTDIFNRMCPGLLSMLSENATEANALAARATYSEKTLWVMMEVIAQKITSDILPAYGIKLKGHFDDPRVVDRKLELEEQNAYERSHTLEETRKEYYQDQPLGDERDKELMGNVKSISVGVSGSISQPNTQSTPTDTVSGEQLPIQDTGTQDVSMKLAVEELLKWRRMVLRSNGKNNKAEKAANFHSDILPESTMKAIKYRLTLTEDKTALAQIFDNYIEDLKPKPQVNPNDLLKSIELGVRALEAVRVS